MKQLTPISESLHNFQCFELILVDVLLTNDKHTVKLIALHTFSRHKLKLLSMCCVYKARQCRTRSNISRNLRLDV